MTTPFKATTTIQLEITVKTTDIERAQELLNSARRRIERGVRSMDSINVEMREQSSILECEWCGGLFEKTNLRGAVARFCSSAHSQQAWRQKRDRVQV